MLRGFVYFVRTHTRSTVPLGRSAPALGGDGTVANILIISEMIRVGKGLINADAKITMKRGRKFSVHCAHQGVESQVSQVGG